MHTLISFLVVIAILVVVHEYGHFLAARLCGVKVLRFSVGFGKVVWKRCFGADQTEFALSLVPLGGYVKMLDEREGPVAASEQHRAFNRQTLGRRSVIVVAGPLANFLFAVFAYWLVFILGTQELRPILGAPPPASAAAHAGLSEGGQVTHVDGEAIDTWQGLRWALLVRAGLQDTVQLRLQEADGEIALRTLRLARDDGEALAEKFIEDLGLRLYRPQLPPVLGRVNPGSPADAAGLLAADTIRAIDGEPLSHWQELVDKVQESRGRPLLLTIERDGQLIQRSVVPEVIDDGGKPGARIGVQVDSTHAARVDMWIEVKHPPLTAFGLAMRETWDKSVFTLQIFGRMLTGEVSWKNLSGPVTIADYAGQSAQLGVTYFLQFLALVSISLGVLNLLPVPLLDGGHLMYYAYEAVRRAPPSEQAMEYGQRIGLALLALLMFFAFYNDINRLLSG